DGVRIYNNTYTDITNNSFTNVRMGIELGNFHQLNAGAAREIHHNTITTRRRGVFYNLFNVGSTILVHDNTINATNDNLGFGGSLWTGVYLISQGGTTVTTFQNNTINGAGSNYPLKAGYTVINT